MFSEIVARVAPSVVCILGGAAREDEQQQLQMSVITGTGFLIRPNLIVTAGHVVTTMKNGRYSPVPNVSVFTFGDKLIRQTRVLTGEVHNRYDVAVLRLADELHVESLQLSFDEQPIGRMVGTLGYPLISAEQGSASSSARFEPILKFHAGYLAAVIGDENDQYFYVTVTTLYHGASGSPLFLNDGRVIAVGVSHSLDRETRSALNMSQWIPLAVVEDMLQRNINGI